MIGPCPANCIWTWSRSWSWSRIEWDFCWRHSEIIGTPPRTPPPLSNGMGETRAKIWDMLFCANSLYLALSRSSAMFIYDVNKPLKWELRAQSQSPSWQRRWPRRKRRSSACSLSLALANALWLPGMVYYPPTHTHKSESALALLSREQASSCFCVKHMWWKRDGGRVRVEGWNVAPPHFSVAQRLRSAPFEFRSWFHSSWVVFQLYPNEKPVRGASKKARWRQGESETERAREIYDYTWSPLSLRNIIVYGRLLFEDLDLRPLKWLAFECIFHSTRFNLTRPNTSSLVVWVLYRRWTWKLLY